MALDIGSIKTAIKTAFDTYNTTTAAYDLSTGLSKRVKNVFTIRPGAENVNASFIPVIAIWADSKSIENAGICKNQLTAKRKATLDINIAGFIWNSKFSGKDKDPAADDIEKLMENMEEVLRRNDTLGGTVLYQYPIDVSYHDLRMSKEEHYRVGAMVLRCQVFY